MNPTQFWKNFRLGDELSISGTFIYNGLRRFHEIRKLDYTDEVFEVLYYLSVGLERLLKIAVVLLEHDDSTDQAQLEKSLITHSHLELLGRIRKCVSVNLDPPHHDLLSLLTTFYKSFRYDRFSLSSVTDPKKEMEILCDYLSKYLKVDIELDVPLFGTNNEDRYRRFVRKAVLRISTTVYTVIANQARDLNLYTYELRSGSKAASVFMGQVDILHEDVLWKELLIFFMNTKQTSQYLEFLRTICPLDFDPELVGDYLDCFRSDAAKALVMDELEQHYTELEAKGTRIEMMGIIGSPNAFFDSPDDEETFDP